MAYKITDSCVACGTCIGECPTEAISAGDIYVIDPRIKSGNTGHDRLGRYSVHI